MIKFLVMKISMIVFSSKIGMSGSNSGDEDEHDSVWFKIGMVHGNSVDEDERDVVWLKIGMVDSNSGDEYKHDGVSGKNWYG